MLPAVILSYAAAGLSVLLLLGVLLRTEGSLVNRAFAIGLGLLGVEALCIAQGLRSLPIESVVFWHKGRHLALALMPGVWLLFSVVYARGNAAEFLRRWKYAIGAFLLAPAIISLGFQGHLVTSVVLVAKAETHFINLGWAGMVLHLIALVCSILILANLERTFAASVGTMRWRIKFMMLGLGLLFGARIYTSSQALLYRSISPTLPVVDVVALLVTCALAGFSLLRAKLFETEIYPSHAVLHRSLTAVLASTYLLVVGIFAKIVSSLGGAGAFPAQAFLVLVAVVGVGVLLLSDRVRQRVGLFVSRHFRRPMYDYRQVWSVFTERTTTLMDRNEFCRAVSKLVSETFGSLSVTVWLVDDQKRQLVFAASTLLAEDKARDLTAAHGGSEDLIRWLRENPQPVDIDNGDAERLVDLRKWNPDFFQKGGNRVCVPLVSGGEVLGMITLADRVSGVPFAIADLDLLKCVGDQVAASLRNIQLSQHFVRAKEMEAFQTMSTFFVHDLKNMAYTLSLMLQNMSEHFGDPAFREDALRSLSKNVNHLNDLIKRFSQLRQGMQLKPVEASLSEVVSATLKSIGTLPGVKLMDELAPVPPAQLDPEQLQKVITNLVLNAKDAVGPQGEIRVCTGQHNGWLRLTVSDNGSGMTPEFMERSLFRPFQTTKKNGMGIGMFHSKMIVEAHRGRMEVESEPGKGTTFRVLLPVEKPK